MIHFQNLTIKEFIKLNSDLIPNSVLIMLENYISELEESNSENLDKLKKENEQLNFTIELKDEQLFFAQELVQAIDKFAESNLSKNKLNQYRILRDDSNFEL